MTVEIVIDCKDWPKDTEKWVKLAVQAALETLEEAQDWEISVRLTTDETMRKLNQEYRSQDKATNVLSWPSVEYENSPNAKPKPLFERDGFLGDLAFGYETCRDEAEAIGLEAHMKHLVIHGIYHLLGYDHQDTDEADFMETLEISALGRLNIANPYEDIKQ